MVCRAVPIVERISTQVLNVMITLYTDRIMLANVRWWEWQFYPYCETWIHATCNFHQQYQIFKCRGGWAKRIFKSMVPEKVKKTGSVSKPASLLPRLKRIDWRANGYCYDTLLPIERQLLYEQFGKTWWIEKALNSSILNHWSPRITLEIPKIVK